MEKDTYWPYAHVVALWDLSKKNMSPREIAITLAKSEAEVLAKAEELGISLTFTPLKKPDQ
jgi:hypothetical protein